jgi:DNA-binding GntR family transcriptional regulator
MARKRAANISNGIYAQLKEQIISLKIPPGQMLVETQLTEQFNVSRTPVREALIRLVREDLLVEADGRIYVQNLTLKDIQEIYQIREALERQALKLSIDNTDKKIIRKLKRLNRDLETTLKDKNYSDYFKNDAAFHETIIEASGNSRIQQILSHYSEQVGRIRFLSVFIPDRLSRTLKEHCAVIEALEAKDLFKAEKALSRHISNVLTGMEELTRGLGSEDLGSIATVSHLGETSSTG